MKSKLIFSLIAFSITLLLPAIGRAQNVTLEDVRKEIRELQRQLDETKKLYEEKINRLEIQINQLEQQVKTPAELPSATDISASHPARGSLATLPDISFIGNIIGSFGEEQDNRVYLDGVELALGGYIFPNARADVILGIHRHEDHYETELEEAYVSFLNLPGGFGLQAGKKLLDFGKINSMHGHHYVFVDEPLVTAGYFGGHGMIGNGVSVNYLFPLSFFLQGSVGYRVLEDHECEGGSHHTFAPTSNAFNARLWSSFPVGESNELEIGGSYLRAKGPHHSDSAEDVDDINVYGLDLTLKNAGSGFRRLLLRNEIYFLHRDRVKPGVIDEEWWRKGLYSLLNCRFNQYWDAGIRYDWFEDAGMDEETNAAFSLFATRSLTETTKLRAQASYHAEENDWRFYVQALFGIGPHAHPLE